MTKRGAPATASPIRDRLTKILDGYRNDKAIKGVNTPSPARAALHEARTLLEESAPVRARAQILVTASNGNGLWANVPWIACADQRETSGVTVTLFFCADMSGVYLTLVQDAKAEKKKSGQRAAWERLRARAEGLRPTFTELGAYGFRLDGGIQLKSTTATGKSYEPATIAHKLYPKGALPDDAALLADLDAALDAYQRYVAGPAAAGSVAAGPAAAGSVAAGPAAAGPVAARPGAAKPIPAGRRPRRFDREAALAELTTAIAARGFVFEPWQIAAYVTALRTKPFVILAGVSGTGKSRLPALVAELTGGVATLLPVRPDWTDSSDVLGYTDLRGRFRPGPLLALARAAASLPGKHHVCILDEMNLARVEQYFAEVLSRIEGRDTPGGGPLLSQRPSGADAHWAGVGLPENLALVGTVNMDETTHGFSRKVLDRAFSLEISDIDLSRWGAAHDEGSKLPAGAAPAGPSAWPAEAFRPRAVRLGAFEPTAGEDALVGAAVNALTEVNVLLGRAQLQVGYRVRDEVALFLVHAREVKGAWKTRADVAVDPLDLALMMKILPRIAGGTASVREVVAALFGWASEGGKPWSGEDDAAPALSAWTKAGRPASVEGARYPRMAARLALMHERLLAEGYTSFWA